MTTTAYAGWIVQLDPPAVASDRTMLDINNPSTGIMIGGTQSGQGIDWGTSQFTQYMSQQGQWGEAPAGYEVPNRTITIPLILGAGDVSADDAGETLAAKVARLQLEGGHLLRQTADGVPMYADIVDAQITIPDVWAEGADVEPGVNLVLTCMPDFYGNEMPLDVIASSSGILAAALTDSGNPAVIKGDYPARCRIVINETADQDRHGLIYGLRSRHYDSADTAALVYEAEVLSPINGSTILAGASYSGGEAVSMAIPVASVWTPMLLTSLADGSPLTHQGTYRVLARVDSESGGQFRLAWSVGTLAVPVANEPVAVTEGLWLVDLGVVRLDPQPVGANAWYGVVQTYGNVNANVAVDQLILEPLDDGAGHMTYVATVSEAPTVITTNAFGGSVTSDNLNDGVVAWDIVDASSTNDEMAALSSATEGNPSTGGASQDLVCSDFGFALPDDATILGITISYQYNLFSGTFPAEAVWMRKAGAEVGIHKSGPTMSEQGGPFTSVFGSASDLWGATWAPSDVNGSGFGCRISCQVFPDAGDYGLILQDLTLTVYYQLESGFAIPDDAVLYARRTAELRTEGMYRTYDGNVYGPISQVSGDLPRLPPSGVEGRPVELLVRPSSGEFDTEADSFADFTAQVFYRPCWLRRQ